MSTPSEASTLLPLPRFSAIAIDQIEPQLDALLADNRRRIAEMLAGEQPALAQLALLEQWDDQLEQFWSPVSHLNAVKNSPELRDVYNACLPKLTAYGTELGQHQGLYRLYQSVAESDDYAQLRAEQRMAVDNARRDFRLSGIALPEQQRQRFADIKQRLAELSTQFANNVLDATQGWSKQITDKALLAGIPDTAVALYRQNAIDQQQDGYLITLDIPAYLPAMQYADNRALREELYCAYTTRASEQGPNAGQWDNSGLMPEIVSLRQELAALLDFDNYSAFSLATKMAESPDQVLDFLYDLAHRTAEVAHRDYVELEAFAKSLGAEQLNAWDVPYYSEKLRLQKYALSQQELRPYFPVDTVVAGLFAVVNRLFAVEIEQQSSFDSYHPDVRFYQLKRDGKTIAGFYLDLFARANKRGGAWMADCAVRRYNQQQQLQLPVAFLTCNFTPPTEQQPSLLTHDEVTTLFHEFGHGLHHMLTAINTAAVSGINGVAWDAVELPSQFLENWCWQQPAIDLISSHYETGESLPTSLLEKMLQAKNFQSGMQMVRQLEFALFDFSMHCDMKEADVEAVNRILEQVRKEVAVYPVPDFNRFQHSFSHIFAGGYAAGYYSYKWAEVLSADAFSRFEEDGIFNADTGRAFLQEILQQGGARSAMDCFKAFRGREPTVDALLRHSGIQ